MWLLKLKLQHNCIVARRLKKYNLVGYSLPLGTWQTGKYSYTSHKTTVSGNSKEIHDFLIDLKNDKEIVNIEISGNTFIIVQKRKTKELISAHFNPKMFLVKPVYTDRNGTKHCEFASLTKETLMEFLRDLKKSNPKLVLHTFKKVKLQSLHFAGLIPILSAKQSELFQLAVEHGYYSFPRKTDLKTLAKMLKVSVSTAQEHLRKAEAKIFPSLVTPDM